jgi:hypothetical protein
MATNLPQAGPTPLLPPPTVIPSGIPAHDPDNPEQFQIDGAQLIALINHIPGAGALLAKHWGKISSVLLTVAMLAGAAGNWMAQNKPPAPVTPPAPQPQIEKKADAVQVTPVVREAGK